MTLEMLEMRTRNNIQAVRGIANGIYANIDALVQHHGYSAEGDHMDRLRAQADILRDAAEKCRELLPEQVYRITARHDFI